MVFFTSKHLNCKHSAVGYSVNVTSQSEGWFPARDFYQAVTHEGSPAFLLYSDMSITSGTQMVLVAARCSEESRSFMMAENAGRSLKLHIQQYLIRSYLKQQNIQEIHITVV